MIMCCVGGESELVSCYGASSVHYMYMYVTMRVLMSVDGTCFIFGRDVSQATVTTESFPFTYEEHNRRLSETFSRGLVPEWSRRPNMTHSFCCRNHFFFFCISTSASAPSPEALESVSFQVEIFRFYIHGTTLSSWDICIPPICIPRTLLKKRSSLGPHARCTFSDTDISIGGLRDNFWKMSTATDSDMSILTYSSSWLFQELQD